jgi:hypothetical protein
MKANLQRRSESGRRLIFLLILIASFGGALASASGVSEDVYTKYNSLLWDGRSTKPWFK